MVRFSSLFVVILIVPGLADAQPFGRGPRNDKDFATDRDTFHFLLENRDTITRKVMDLNDGVETVTESTDEKVTDRIREHVKAMYARLEESRPIHMRDPLFRAIFQNADKIRMAMEPTERGVKVRETSDDPHVVRLIQAHARVVSLFIKNGHAEVHKNHELTAVEAKKPEVLV